MDFPAKKIRKTRILVKTRKVTCLFQRGTNTRASFNNLLCMVTACSALFEKRTNLSSGKTFKNTGHLSDCSIPNAKKILKKKMKNLEEKIHDCTLFLSFLPFSCYTKRMPLSSRISPEYGTHVTARKRKSPTVDSII